MFLVDRKVQHNVHSMETCSMLLEKLLPRVSLTFGDWDYVIMKHLQIGCTGYLSLHEQKSICSSFNDAVRKFHCIARNGL
jgi:hypothetical protein